MITFADIKKFIAENELPEDTEIQVTDGEEGFESASELIITNELDSHFRMSKPKIRIQ